MLLRRDLQHEVAQLRVRVLTTRPFFTACPVRPCPLSLHGKKKAVSLFNTFYIENTFYIYIDTPVSFRFLPPLTPCRLQLLAPAAHCLAPHNFESHLSDQLSFLLCLLLLLSQTRHLQQAAVAADCELVLPPATIAFAPYPSAAGAPAAYQPPVSLKNTFYIENIIFYTQ